MKIIKSRYETYFKTWETQVIVKVATFICVFHKIQADC